jgi:starch synthase
MLSLECAGLAQAGGLGEAVAGLSKTLAVDSELDVSVFLPSHGSHLDPGIREAYGLQELTTFIAQGHRTGLNGSWYNYLASMEKGSRHRVNYFLAKGLDSATSKWLDDPIIYDHETTYEKMSLLARTLGSYTEYLFSMGRTAELPDLIHAHDWHMVPAGVLVKQGLQERGRITPLVFTVHLLSGVTLPWHYASEDWCGIRDVQHSVRMGGKRVSTLKYSQLWQDVCHNSLEKFGCYEADYVTSVSESYLSHDIRSFVGDVIRGKSGYIYNGCDWDPGSIESAVLPERSEGIKPGQAKETPDRWDLRKYLLTSRLSQAGRDTKKGNSTEPARESRNIKPGSIEVFRKDGPLVLMTGRLSPQKGVDLLLDAVPLVVKVIPNAKFLLFLLRSNDSDLTKQTVAKVAMHPNNVRAIFGKHPSLYLLSHLAADVYAMPSRSEPFGISALEAMVTGNPVVGTNVGGITETVLDVYSHGESATGILVPPEDVAKLAESLISLLHVMQIDERCKRGRGGDATLSPGIPSKSIAKMVAKNPSLGSKIRQNCRSRVEKYFRWKNAGQVAVKRYDAAQLLAARALQVSDLKKRAPNGGSVIETL